MATAKNKIKTYVDTSVFGGVFDKEFKKQSSTFFKQVRNKQFYLVTSAVVQAEIQVAPTEVNDCFNEILAYAEVIEITEEA